MTSSVSNLLSQSHQCSQSGQLEKAAQICNQVLALQPKNAAAHFQLGVIALKQGHHELAVDCVSRAIQIDPSQPNFHIVLGIAYSNLGNLPQGARCFQRTLELSPDDPFAHNNLGSNYKNQGKMAAAEQCFRAAISIAPDFLEAHVNLGDLLGSQGKLAAAADGYRRALQIKADLPVAQFNLALALHHMQDYEAAVTLFRRVAAGEPAYPGVDNMLGVTLMRIGKFDEAIANYQKAITSEPGRAAPHVNLGDALHSRGDPNGAVASFRKALSVNPDHASAHSNLLLTLNYLPDQSQQALYREALQFDLQHSRNLLPVLPSFRNSRKKNKVLRIGYLSPDFRSHSVAHFTWKLLDAHNRRRVEVFCYADVMKQDEITRRMRSQADQWLSIVGIADEDVAARIRMDRIDILIDLAGHTANNRLLIFARKPAPIQVTWLGYPNTTGMRAMDYRLTDAEADPPGAADRLHAEKLVRLPHGFLCYQTDDPACSVSAPPCLKRGHVTFGSFNHLPKLTPEVMRVWSVILKSMPDTRLVLKSGPLVDENTRAKCLEIFAGQGISPDRVDLLGMHPSRKEHLGMYSGIDIGLDPFPYNGTTTTFEALWMGVPVICLRGERHAGRVGASIMHHVGLPELVADSEDEYVDLAQRLAGDTKRLVALRNEIRPQLRESVLMDVSLFAETLENAYRKMWLTWCDSA